MRHLSRQCSVLVVLSVFLLELIAARGCYKDPKVYIVRVPQEEQFGLIMAAMEACFTKIQNEALQNTPDTGNYCNATFDRVMCWPRTRAGTTLEQSCPNYINNFNTRAKARRRCMPDGTWYIHPETNDTYTDFTDCASADNPDDTRDNHFNWSCKLVFSVFNYIIVANYVWIFIEGLYLHNVIFITTFKKSKRFYIYILFGWCSPVLCVVPWVVVRRYLEDTLCWSTHSAENKFVWIIRGPIVFTVVINFLFFLNIIRVLFTKLTAVHMSDPHRYRKLARSTLVLIPLFGVYYMISVVMPECMDPGLELVWLYVESGVNSFQVQHEIRKKWTRRWALRRLSTFSTRSTRTLSLGSTVFVKDKPIPSAMFSDVTINVNMDDKQCQLGLDELKHDEKVTNNNVVDDTRNERAPSEDENDTLL